MASEASSGGKRRRNRVPVSCFSCRTLKTKCDGIRPVCSTCAYNGRQCVFVQHGIAGRAPDTVMVRKDYLRGLEKRLEILEKTASSPEAGRSQTAVSYSPPSALGQEHHVSKSDQSGPFRETEPSAATSSSIVIDTNVSIGGVTFTQLILNSLQGPENVKAQSLVTDNEVRDKKTMLTEGDLYALPNNVGDVLDQFFERRNLLGPLFHAPTVRPMFDEALRCPPNERYHHRSTFVLLNMILALCTSHWQTDTNASPHTARRHYDIAMILLQPTLLRDWTIAHVQALVLGARYLQGTSCGDECWNLLGLAIRIAYGLRLHLDPPDTDPFPLRETKRRVWYSAYTLDMHFSMIYGRPSATRSSDFSVQPPEDLEDDCIQDNTLLYPTPRRPSFMSFFLEVIKLYKIVEMVLGRLSENKESPRDTAEMVMSLDEDYQKWLREVPPHLVLDYNDPKEPPWILALRGNMVRILIHRQSLGVTLNRLVKPQQIEDSLVSHVLQYSRSACVSAAMETIDIVALRHDQTKVTMGLDWFNIYYVFNAVIVLVSHVVDPAHSQDQPALAKVDKALQMIKAMSSNHSFAQRAYSFLQQLLGYMHQSVGSRQNKEDGACFSGELPPVQTATGASTCMSAGAEIFPDLQAVFGFTQTLTGNLETQLGNFDARGLPEQQWAFNGHNPFNGFS